MREIGTEMEWVLRYLTIAEGKRVRGARRSRGANAAGEQVRWRATSGRISCRFGAD